ncbi:hypothetical protein [Flagellimonas iocasae]|uniref:Uncharacterized protein n=1 Tax=Flagellimonas iocasae TaxID=2055905 RepID=A0ABW4XUR8_9FLAO
MNTKKVFFGLLAVSFLAMTAVSTSMVDINKDQVVSVKKKDIPKQ